MSGLGPLTARDLKKWYRNPVSLITGLIQPFFWLALFGYAFSKLGTIDPAAIDYAPTYITFLLGGVLTIIGLFTAMFSGVNIIFDRRLGPLSRFLMSPIHRSSIVFAKIISAMVRILVQVGIIILAALILPNGLIFAHGFTVEGALVIVTAVVLVAFIFSSMFSIIAVRITRPDTIFGILNLVNLPLLFTSYAMFPPALMAGWLSTVAQYNPVSWSAESIRTVILNGTMLTAAQGSQLLTWLGGLALLAVVMLIIVYFVSEKEIRE